MSTEPPTGRVGRERFWGPPTTQINGSAPWGGRRERLDPEFATATGRASSGEATGQLWFSPSEEDPLYR